MPRDEAPLTVPVATLRCPVCFVREIDVLLLHDGSWYYCTKCSYRGSAAEVHAAHQVSKSKFRNIATRLDLDQIDRL